MDEPEVNAAVENAAVAVENAAEAEAEAAAAAAAVAGVAAAKAGAAVAHTEAAAASQSAAERMQQYETEAAEWRNQQTAMLADLGGRTEALTGAFQTLLTDLPTIIASSIQAQSPQPPVEAEVAIVEPPPSAVANPPVEQTRRRKRVFLRGRR